MPGDCPGARRVTGGEAEFGPAAWTEAGLHLVDQMSNSDGHTGASRTWLGLVLRELVSSLVPFLCMPCMLPTGPEFCGSWLHARHPTLPRKWPTLAASPSAAEPWHSGEASAPCDTTRKPWHWCSCRPRKSLIPPNPGPLPAVPHTSAQGQRPGALLSPKGSVFLHKR